MPGMVTTLLTVCFFIFLFRDGVERPVHAVLRRAALQRPRDVRAPAAGYRRQRRHRRVPGHDHPVLSRRLVLVARLGHHPGENGKYVDGLRHTPMPPQKDVA